MSKAAASDNKKALVPKLRFPEFRRQTGWKAALLSSLEKDVSLELGRGNVISHKDIEAIPGTYPVYSSSIKNDGCIGAYGKFMFDEEMISWSIDGGGNFFYRPKHKFSVTNVSGYMRILSDDLVTRFVAYQLELLHAHRVFDYQLKAHPSVIRDLYKLGLPSRDEQQKIADCLSSLDALITAHTDKLAALKTHKQGLLQQLFPKGGETVPRLRFPDFRNAAEWTDSTLENMAQGKLNNGVFNDPRTAGNGYKLINVSDMYVETTIRDENLSLTGISSAEFEKNKVSHGDLFFTRSSLVKEGIAKSNIYLGNDPDVTFDGHLVRLVSNRNVVLPMFLYYAVQTSPVRRQLVATSKTATMTTIGQSDIASTSLRVPQKGEQRAVADCLSTLDTLITAQTDKLAALKQHKQGLLQQLFPVMDVAAA